MERGETNWTGGERELRTLSSTAFVLHFAQMRPISKKGIEKGYAKKETRGMERASAPFPPSNGPVRPPVALFHNEEALSRRKKTENNGMVREVRPAFALRLHSKGRAPDRPMRAV